MTRTEFLKKQKFNSFERYPPQFMTIYLKCKGRHKKHLRPLTQFIRVNLFNAATFDPMVLERKLDDKYSWWTYSWLPAEETDKLYDEYKRNNI